MIDHFYTKIPGWFAFRPQYERMFQQLSNDSVWVEVGSYYGRSLAWLMVEMANSNKKFKVFAIDSWEGNNSEDFYLNARKTNPECFDNLYNDFKSNLSLFENDYTAYKMLSWDAAENFANFTVDYVMIDAGHNYDSVKKDINSWWPKLKKGGYLGGDDYSITHADGVNTAVDEFVSENNLILELLPSYKKNQVISKKARNWLLKKD